MEPTNKSNVLDRLSEGIAKLTDSDKWQEWLTVQSRFHKYSFNNTLLILLQRPDASRVAGFNAWRQFDRFVRKGEKGIWILAPMAYKTEIETTDGQTETHRQIRGFKPVAVFDLEQTDGKELPEICTRIDGEDDEQLFAKLVIVAEQIGFTVEHSDELGSANGDCSHDLKRIRVKPTNAPAQQVKTLAHELGHAILHAPDDERPTERALIELEAESVAFIVCADLGIASDDYTFGYVAGWAGGGDEAVAAIKASGSRIQKAADQILQSVTAMTVAAEAEEAA